MAEILFSFDVCLSVCLCLCVCAQRTGQSDQFKMVKAMDFNLTNMFPGQSGHDLLKFFEEGLN